MRFSAEHPIVRAATRDPRIVARFWTFVERDDSADACWEWRGRRSGGDHPIFVIKSHSVSAARVAWFAATGEFPLGGRLRRTCQNAACIRPEHLAWDLGIQSERMIRSESDGYVSVPAVADRARDYGGDETLRRRAG
jgi:hypothetical protein